MEISYVQLTTIILAIFFGVVLSILSRRLQIPAIAPLLFGGIILGTEGLGLVNPMSLGDSLRVIISLSVATILFEGGLTLESRGFDQVRGVISKLLSVGVVITWLGTAFSIHLLFEFSLPLSVLAGSLIIVTGPTVITPLLQRIRVKEKLHHILHWEGVLIDPIGVFIAILCFEWLSIEGALWQHIMEFSLRLIIGLGLGALGGYTIYWMLKKNWIPEEQINIFTLAAALMLFGISDFLVHEAGILTVVIAGLVLGWKKHPILKNVKQFKSELTELAIGVLFILLAANLRLGDFIKLGWRVAVLIGIVLFLIRPLGVVISTIGSSLTLRERSFLAWLAPRGVVAGSMASLFTIELKSMGEPNSTFLEAFTFTIIGITIVVQGLLSGPLARFLDVKAPPNKGWLIVGAHYFSRKVARFISKYTSDPCILVDTNGDEVQEAITEGLQAFQGNALSDETVPAELKTKIGNVIALTDNRDLNQLVCDKWSDVAPQNQLFRWSPPESEFSGQLRAKGLPIWSDLPKPSQVSFNLRNKQVVLFHTRTEKISQNLLSRAVPLIVQIRKHFKLNSFDWKEDGEVLLFQQFAHQLPFYLHPENIFYGAKDANLEQLISSILEKVVEIYPDVPFDETRNQLLETKGKPPLVLGQGIVFLHTQSPEFKEPICIVSLNPDGINLEAQDAELSKLFFVLLSPQNEPELHLTLLADIAKIASDSELIHSLIDSKDYQEFSQKLMNM